MTEILLIRHTQAEGNLYRMMQGHWDGDVTAHGWEQIGALAERLKDLPIDAVYTSDLYRARMTAGAVTKYHALPLQTDPRLREINVGPWEMGFLGNIRHDFPEQAENFIFHPDRWHIDGAETYADVQARACAALDEIVRRHDGQRVAVVSHGVTIRCILSKVLGVPLDDVERLPVYFNTSVTVLRCADGVYTAVKENDCSHLARPAAAAWRKNDALRDASIDPCSQRDYYCRCYAAAWEAAHGSLEGFDALACLARAREHYLHDREAVLMILEQDRPVGLVELDVARGAREGFGWISLLYLCEEYRGRGYGIQLLARAVKKYTMLQRQALRLHVAEENGAALRFYRRCGFRTVGEERGACGRLLLMEHGLRGGQHV